PRRLWVVDGSRLSPHLGRPARVAGRGLPHYLRQQAPERGAVLLHGWVGAALAPWRFVPRRVGLGTGQPVPGPLPARLVGVPAAGRNGRRRRARNVGLARPLKGFREYDVTVRPGSPPREA